MTNATDKIADSLLETIMGHGLSVRKIPEVVTERLDVRHIDKYPDGKLVRTSWYSEPQKKEISRDWLIISRVPKYAGWWMVQKVKGTNSMVRWSLENHHLSPTLSEAVQSYLDDPDKGAFARKNYTEVEITREELDVRQ